MGALRPADAGPHAYPTTGRTCVQHGCSHRDQAAPRLLAIYSATTQDTVTQVQLRGTLDAPQSIETPRVMVGMRGHVRCHRRHQRWCIK